MIHMRNGHNTYTASPPTPGAASNVLSAYLQTISRVPYWSINITSSLVASWHAALPKVVCNMSIHLLQVS